MISNNSDIVWVIPYHYWYNSYQGKYYQWGDWDQHSIILWDHNKHKDNSDRLNWYHILLSYVITALQPNKINLATSTSALFSTIQHHTKDQNVLLNVQKRDVFHTLISSFECICPSRDISDCVIDAKKGKERIDVCLFYNDDLLKWQ